MELLFDLINRNKIDISDISIVEITQQYVEYVENMKENKLEIASEFISMASKLLEIKSRYLLYLKQNRDDIEDPRVELVQQIEEYKKVRAIAEELKGDIKEYDDKFYRTKMEIFDEEEEELDLSAINLDEIKKLLPKLLKAFAKEDQDVDEVLEKNVKLKKIVKNKQISVESKIDSIREVFSRNNSVRFSEILESRDKREIIANFLAVLELIKLKEIVIKQDKLYEDILIEAKKDEKEVDEPQEVEDDNEKVAKKANRRMKRKLEKGVENSEEK